MARGLAGTIEVLGDKINQMLAGFMSNARAALFWGWQGDKNEMIPHLTAEQVYGQPFRRGGSKPKGKALLLGRSRKGARLR